MIDTTGASAYLEINANLLQRQIEEELAEAEPAPPVSYAAKAADHAAKAKAAAPAKRMERFKQLHLFEQKIVMPNLVAKTGLFAPVKPGRRAKTWEYKSVPVWGLPGVEVSYKYEQLNQLDLNVYLLLVSYACRRHENFAAFTRSEALKALRMNDSGFSYKVFDKFIDRLGSTRVQIVVDGISEQGKEKPYVLRDALAPRDYQETREGLYVVELSKSLRGFFEVDDWSLFTFNQRLELGQNQWALIVHAFISVNRPPAWFTWEQIRQLWGQGYADLSMLRRNFRRRVLKPLFDVGFLKRVQEKAPTEKNPGGSIGLWW